MNMLVKSFCFLLTFLLPGFCLYCQPQARHNLQVTSLALSWDEGLPLSNGLIGALVWQNPTNLHLSPDRADLRDSRPMQGLHRPEFRYG